MSRYDYRPYVPVAERRRLAEVAAAKQAKRTGRPAAPVRIEGRTIASTFWGKAWCENLEAYSDFANRLPRGRTYVRNGSVADLHIAEGRVEALVQGSELYKIQVSFQALPKARWEAFKQRSAGRVTNLLDLLQGRLSKEILTDLTTRETGLFPAPSEIQMKCSCPDWATLCKHVAAVLYGVGARLDHQPELFFTLRGVEVGELIASATEEATGALGPATETPEALAGEDLSALFGVELEAQPTAPQSPARRPTPISPAQPAPRAKRSTAASVRPRVGPAKTKAKPGPTARKAPTAAARSATHSSAPQPARGKSSPARKAKAAGRPKKPARSARSG